MIQRFLIGRLLLLSQLMKIQVQQILSSSTSFFLLVIFVFDHCLHLNRLHTSLTNLCNIFIVFLFHKFQRFFLSDFCFVKDSSTSSSSSDTLLKHFLKFFFIHFLHCVDHSLNHSHFRWFSASSSQNLLLLKLFSSFSIVFRFVFTFLLRVTFFIFLFFSGFTIATALSTGFSSGLTTSPLPLSILAASDEPCFTGFCHLSLLLSQVVDLPLSFFNSSTVSRFFSNSDMFFSCLSLLFYLYVISSQQTFSIGLI